jgi:hypothetical protein
MMKISRHGAAATAITLLLASTNTAYAVETHWEFQGRIATVSNGPGVPPDWTPGTPYRIVVGFDTNATLDVVIDGTASGKRYNYSGDTRFQIYMGTTCNPCDFRDPQGFVFLRDDYANLVGDPAVPETAVDGYSFGLQENDASIGLIMRGPVTDIVNGPTLAVSPDPRLAGLEIATLQICAPFPGTPPEFEDRCADIELDAPIDSVKRPAFGTGYILTARDCRIESLGVNDTTKTDCNNSGGAFFRSGPRVQAWSWPGPVTGPGGGGVGSGAIDETFMPSTDDIDAVWDDGTTIAADRRDTLGLPNAALGTIRGAISFGGPIALPIVKATSVPSPISRTNSNVYAYQQYVYSGGVTDLPLVLDLTYQIAENSNDPTASAQVGNRPGGASIGATLAVVDSSKVTLEQIFQVASSASLNALSCNAESTFGWPAGSILGVAKHDSSPAEQDSQEVRKDVLDCDQPGVPVQLAAGQNFTVTVAMQTPARGREAQFPSSLDAPADGLLDAANTLRVRFSETASPALIQQLVADIAPGCEPNCGYPAIDIKPDDPDNCIKVDAKTVPVAILGTANFRANEVVAGSLRLGTLSPNVLKNGKLHCELTDANLDGIEDLVCQFKNLPSNWSTGQSSETLRGQSAGGPLELSDQVCLKP